MAKMQKKKSIQKRINKNTLRSALVAGLKAQTGRKDIKFEKAVKVAAKTEKTIPIEQRAGYPLAFPKGAVDPKDWKTHNGVKIEVDFTRCPWLPDDWGQGVKMTIANSRSTKGGGGILTTFVGPDMKSFFHKSTVEKYVGRSLTKEDGWNGQVRLARLQAEQAVQVARMQVKEKAKGGSNELIGPDPDPEFFKLLTAQERKHLASKDAFHFCVVSARRATSVEGVRDIFMVQNQFVEAGVSPTWYVDAASLKSYQALGLKAVVGGKLTPARNKALLDARRMGKVCVQSSDDISAWEYREGKQAKERSDDAMNAACNAARRYIVSPVAAARFILAKMRSEEDPKPKLGGVYMLGSCARTFAGEAFARHHFILGDFFVAEFDSRVIFDENMTLKEDYDFSCAHIKAHGSVMRCQRMTLNVKHYDNAGGACSNRDKKGQEEKKNVDLLNKKWPGVFRANPKRRGEVIMSWKRSAGDINDDDGTSDKPREPRKVVRKVALKRQTSLPNGLREASVLLRTKKEIEKDYISKRCNKNSGRTVGVVLSSSYLDANGCLRKYGVSDLRYDISRGYLVAKRR